MNTPSSSPGQSQPGAYKYYVLTVLVVVNTVNFVDRQVINILAPSIQADLSLSDTQVGVLTGLTFGLFYAVMGIPVGRLADRHKRTWVLSAAVAIWSAMTALCGAASSYALLCLARFGVGVGEAGAGPASHSLISDYFAKGERARALGIFSFGVPLGIVVAYLSGGLLAEELGWRMAFVIVGAPGVLIALLVFFTFREPERGAADVGGMLRRDEMPLGEGIRALWSIPTFRTMCYGGALSAYCGYSVNAFTPIFLTRVYDLGPGAMALPMAVSLGVGGGLGAWAGGMLTTWAGKSDPRAVLTLPAITWFIYAAAVIVMFWGGSLQLAYAALFVSGFTQFFLMGPFFGLAQTLAPLRARALATAIIFFVMAAVGLGMGPTITGILSDIIGRSTNEARALQLALSTIPVISASAAILVLMRRGSVREDLVRAGVVDAPSEFS